MHAFFYGAAGVALLLIGAGFFWAAYHVVYLLKHVRLILLPQVELTLTEVQKNLNHIDELTQEVDTTVGSANQIVASANRTVQNLEIVRVDAERQLLLIRGAVPGSRGGDLMVRPAVRAQKVAKAAPAKPAGKGK